MARLAAEEAAAGSEDDEVAKLLEELHLMRREKAVAGVSRAAKLTEWHQAGTAR